MTITVTATWTGGSPTGRLLHVFVLTGATAAGGANAKNVSGFNGNFSITPNASNSFLVWSIYDNAGGTAFSTLTNNTLQDNFSTTHGERLADGYFTGTVTASTPVTVGATSGNGSSGCVAVAYEIEASGGSTPSIDASTPATVSATTSGTTLVTASFTPPAGSVVVAVIESNNSSTNCTIADSSSMVWTRRDTSASGVIGVFTATVPSGGTTNGTASMTAAGSLTAAGIDETLGAAALTAAGSLTAGGTETIQGAAAMAAAGSLSAAGTETTPGAAALTAAGSMSASPSIPTQGAAALAASSSLTAAAAETIQAAAALAAVSSLTATPPAQPATFPPGPLGLRYELLINGTWTDITSYVYERTDQVITRGHPDESTTASPSGLTLTLNNRDGRFSSKNPLGAYYPYIGRNTLLRGSVPEGASYLRLEDDQVSYASAPDSAGLSITGDTELQLDVTLDNWNAQQILASKWVGTGNERSWLLQTNEDATLTFQWSPDGSNKETAQSTASVPIPGLRRQSLRVTLAVASGTVTFYSSPTPLSGSPSWTQVGAPVVVGANSVFNSTAALLAGWNTTDGIDGMNGKIHGLRLLSGIGGTTEASPDFTTQTAGTASFTDAQGNTWTCEGTSEITDRKYRAYMEVSGWPQQWDPTGADVWADTAAAGILRRVTQGAGSRPLQSVFRRALPSAIGLVGYWPAEDGNDMTGAGATPAAPQQFASAIPGGYAGTFTGKPTFASDSSFLCSYPIPALNGSRWHFRLPGRAPDTANVFRFLCHVPSGGDTDGGTLARMFTTGTVDQVDLVYNAGGTLRLLGYNWTASGTPIFDTGIYAFGVNGEPLWVSIELQTSGSNVQYSVVTLQPGAFSGLAVTGTVAGTVGNATELVVNALNFTGGENMSGTAVGQVSYQAEWESMFDFGSQLNAWIGEAAGQRFSRLCGEENLPFRCVGSLDDTVLMGAQTPLALTDLLQECEDADRGTMFEPRQCFALAYRTRASMQNQAAAVTIDYSQKQLAADPQMTTTEDDQYTVNDAIVVNSYTGGSAEVQVTEGPLSVQEPPDGVWVYQTSPQINLAFDSQCTDLAGWITLLGTVDDPRYPVLPLNLARTELASIYYAVQDADIGDRVVVINTPPWLPPDGVTQIMQGTQETLNSFKYMIDWQGVPELPYETGLVNDEVYGRVDTDGSELHASVSSSATSILVDTLPGTPTVLWTTAAADFPFDVSIGGERITVTNITGSSSPQTFTVVRSVNGVVKAQTAGTDVRLFYPTIVSL